MSGLPFSKQNNKKKKKKSDNKLGLEVGRSYRNVRSYLPFATQDRHKTQTLLMKETVNSNEKTLAYKPRSHGGGGGWGATHWETQDTRRVKKGGYIIAERVAYILTRSPSLSV